MPDYTLHCFDDFNELQAKGVIRAIDDREALQAAFAARPDGQRFELWEAGRIVATSREIDRAALE